MDIKQKIQNFINWFKVDKNTWKKRIVTFLGIGIAMAASNEAINFVPDNYKLKCNKSDIYGEIVVYDKSQVSKDDKSELVTLSENDKIIEYHCISNNISSPLVINVNNKNIEESLELREDNVNTFILDSINGTTTYRSFITPYPIQAKKDGLWYSIDSATTSKYYFEKQTKDNIIDKLLFISNVYAVNIQEKVTSWILGGTGCDGDISTCHSTTSPAYYNSNSYTGYLYYGFEEWWRFPVKFNTGYIPDESTIVTSSIKVSFFKLFDCVTTTYSYFTFTNADFPVSDVASSTDWGGCSTGTENIATNNIHIDLLPEGYSTNTYYFNTTGSSHIAKESDNFCGSESGYSCFCLMYGNDIESQTPSCDMFTASLISIEGGNNPVLLPRIYLDITYTGNFSIYDFYNGTTTPGHNAWYGIDSATSVPINASMTQWLWVSSVPFTTLKINQVSSSDYVESTTTIGTPSKYYIFPQLAQVFQFKITDAFDTISQIVLYWEGYLEGYGDNASSTRAIDLIMSLYDWTSSTFKIVKRADDNSCPSNNCTLRYSTTTNFSRYLTSTSGGYLVKFAIQGADVGSNCRNAGGAKCMKHTMATDTAGEYRAIGCQPQSDTEDIYDECDTSGCQTGYCGGVAYFGEFPFDCGWYYDGAQHNCDVCYGCPSSFNPLNKDCEAKTTAPGAGLWGCTGDCETCSSGTCETDSCEGLQCGCGGGMVCASGSCVPDFPANCTLACGGLGSCYPNVPTCLGGGGTPDGNADNCLPTSICCCGI